jgi:hypothetical protein
VTVSGARCSQFHTAIGSPMGIYHRRRAWELTPAISGLNLFSRGREEV